MTGRDLIPAFDWESFENGLSSEVDLLLPGNVGLPLVELRLKANLSRLVDLNSEAIQSAILPLDTLRRQLLIASAELPQLPLEVAANYLGWLATLADKRGDVAGADAWRLVVEAIDNAKRIAAMAVAQQTWDVDDA